MCYEFSHWFSKTRRQEQVRTQPQGNENAAQEAAPAPPTDPAANVPRRKEEQTAPA